MILESKGITIDKFYIPPFCLNEGEIVVLCLFGGQHFHEVAMYLKNIFTGKVVNENVKLNKPLTYVEHFIEPVIRRLFYPVAVGEYLRKNANPKSSYANRIYDIKSINDKTRVNLLDRSQIKFLNIYATLSNTKDIIFDLMGQGPQGAQEIYDIVKEAVTKGGSAILLDNVEDMKNDCSKYVELQKIE